MATTNVLDLEWGRITDCQRIAPFSRSQYNNFIKDRKVISRRIGGTRVIHIPSLREMIEGSPLKPPREVSDRARRLQRASAEVRAGKREQNGITG